MNLLKVNFNKIKHSLRKFFNAFFLGNKEKIEYFKICEFKKESCNLILVVGAESSGTRFIADFLSEHPRVVGKGPNQGHEDYFDQTWQLINRKINNKEIIATFPELSEKVYLTRRSVPHSIYPGTAAKPFEFPPISEFLLYAKEAGYSPIVIITVRSFVPNILSWAQNRASGNSSISTVFKQYEEVYPYIFNEIKSAKIPHLIIPLESIICDEKSAMNSIYNVLDLESYLPSLKVKKNINKKYYTFKT